MHLLHCIGEMFLSFMSIATQMNEKYRQWMENVKIAFGVSVGVTFFRTFRQHCPQSSPLGQEVKNL